MAATLEDAVIVRLHACTTFRDLLHAHGHAKWLCLSQSSYVATQIVRLCKAHGRAAHTLRVFAHVPDPNLHNAMIKAYAQNHLYRDAVEVYVHMLRCLRLPWSAGFSGDDRFTYPFLLKACGGLAAVEPRKIRSARALFDSMPDKKVVSLTTLVSGTRRPAILPKNVIINL
ncbi:hypothetical protein BAE44_0003165 [Dichanthelium oligosanthes]|uniref:Pentatricopeptide repeat-containing protein n=1 Tax=Dichanthelium oligosanthes TaxID=888268 RepID=A0A1E5WEI0_9POAL|nr:hypothetical protein BAE44_0003165 [Dichanthelium oligosanthes]